MHPSSGTIYQKLICPIYQVCDQYRIQNIGKKKILNRQGYNP
ncbi:hypothetical protein PVAP13_3NG240500 [Panicum virgatum]|uniref:Uncharacterized protein n=1 Tax=Panicum virgatum TaxID=38727 RepID=A0A8T0UBM0_PANVG|nr:hypothetical protein PVAP13_3NG240500 [Panicum virgatum]